MKTYFLSSEPCALSINDAFFGVTDLFERFADVHLADNLFIRFTPQNAQPIAFFLNDSIRFKAPDGVEVYFVKDGIALFAKQFPPTDYTLRPITQTQKDNLLVTVFQQGNVQISFQTHTDFQIDVLPKSFAQCEIRFLDNAVLLVCPTHLAVYSLSGKRLFLEEVTHYEIDGNQLSVTMPLSEVLGRSANGVYQIENDALTPISFALTQLRTKDGEERVEDIQAQLLPFAFLETVRCGGNFTAFLHEDLLNKADTLRQFLGDFVAIIPTDDIYVFGLVKRIGERIFDTTYYRIHIKDTKVCDVTG